jgi:hypothetical protein
MRASSRRWLLSTILGTVTVWSIGVTPIVAQSKATAVDASLLGTWTLNLAKSKYSPGPPPRSQQRTYEAHPDGIKVTLNIVDASGRPTTIEYTADYDGVEYAVTGSSDYNRITLRRIDARTADATLSHAGKVFGTARRTVSEDGRTLTISFQQNDPRTSYVAVYDKVK